MKHISVKQKLHGTEYKVNLNLRNRVTIVSGNSGKGKTLVRKLLETKQNIDGFGQEHIGALKQILPEKDSRFQVKDRLIIVDNAECLIHEIPAMLDNINLDRKNHYLVFIRGLERIKVKEESIGELEFNSSTNTFSIKYEVDTEDGRW